MQERTITVDPAHGRAVIEQFCVEAGVPFVESFTSAQAAELATRHDYACTVGTILELQRKGYISAQDTEALSPADVYCLLGALEARRRWKPAPSRHDSKKSGIRLQIEAAQAHGEQPIHDLDSHTVEDLLLQLTQTDNRTLREILYETLRLKLADYEE